MFFCCFVFANQVCSLEVVDILTTSELIAITTYSFWKQCFELPKLSCFVTVLTYRWDLLAPYLALPAVFPYPEGIFHHTIREAQLPRKSPGTPCSKCYRSIGMRKGFVLLCSARSGWSASSSMCFRHSRRGSEKVCHLDKSLRKECKDIKNILPFRKLKRSSNGEMIFHANFYICGRNPTMLTF